MPSRDWQFRIRDIEQAITAIQRRVDHMTFDDFRHSETVVKAVLYDFLVIGEAATNIPSEIRDAYPNIPWRIMADMRNIIAHEYFQVNLNIVWRTIENNLPELLSKLRQLMNDEGIGD